MNRHAVYHVVLPWSFQPRPHEVFSTLSFFHALGPKKETSFSSKLSLTWVCYLSLPPIVSVDFCSVISAASVPKESANCLPRFMRFVVLDQSFYITGPLYACLAFYRCASASGLYNRGPALCSPKYTRQTMKNDITSSKKNRKSIMGPLFNGPSVTRDAQVTYRRPACGRRRLQVKSRPDGLRDGHNDSAFHMEPDNLQRESPQHLQFKARNPGPPARWRAGQHSA